MSSLELSTILRSTTSVFTFKALFLTFPSTKASLLKRKLSYYTKKGELYHIRRGMYAKDKNYDRLELANKIFVPSYISFETVLLSSGINFQYYSQIFIASYQNRELLIDDQKYVFRKLKKTLLLNQIGIEKTDHYYIASPERAVLDMLYLHKDYYFDNLSPLNWEKMYDILPIYGGNKRMASIVKKLEHLAKKNIR